jgi:hypothetical protein
MSSRGSLIGFLTVSRRDRFQRNVHDLRLATASEGPNATAIYVLFEKAVYDAPLRHRPLTDLNCTRGYLGMTGSLTFGEGSNGIG